MSRPLAIVVFLGLGLTCAFFGWAFYAMRDFGGWTGGSSAIALTIGFGALATGALTGGLMWLAFYSSRKGHDEGPRFDDLDRP